jgi:hypothetical protein
MGQVTYQQFIYDVNGPDEIMYNEQYNGMVVMPAYH